MEIDALKIALLAACAAERVSMHRIHGELEHWLNRQLASDEIECALAELAAHDFVVACMRAEDSDWRRITGAAALRLEEAAFAATEDGRALVAARWEEFFPQ